MKCLPLLLLAVLFLPPSLRLSAQETKKKVYKGVPDIEEGQPGLDRPYDLWGGKWDSGLLVFLRVFEPAPDSKPGWSEVRIVQQFQTDAAVYYTKMSAKALPAGYSRANSFSYRLGIGDDPNAGLIYDENGNGRMGNLVKVQEFVADIDTYDILDADWQPGHMPVEEARRIIMGSDADLLGLPTRKTHPMRTAVDEVLVDARLLQEAKDLWVKRGNDPTKVTWADLKPFIHAENRVAVRDGGDLYGRPFSLGDGAQGVTVHPVTYALLREAYPSGWGQFAPTGLVGGGPQ